MVEITKLPPGEATGARNLQNWSNRRLIGRSGTYRDSTPVRVFKCRRCNFKQTRTLSRTVKGKLICPNCGFRKGRLK